MIHLRTPLRQPVSEGKVAWREGSLPALGRTAKRGPAWPFVGGSSKVWGQQHKRPSPVSPYICKTIVWDNTVGILVSSNVAIHTTASEKAPDNEIVKVWRSLQLCCVSVDLSLSSEEKSRVKQWEQPLEFWFLCWCSNYQISYCYIDCQWTFRNLSCQGVGVAGKLLHTSHISQHSLHSQ